MVEIVAPKSGDRNRQGQAGDARSLPDRVPPVLFDAWLSRRVGHRGADRRSRSRSRLAADAFAHLKVIAFTTAAEELVDRAGLTDDVDEDEGMFRVEKADFGAFVEAAKQHRIWSREPRCVRYSAPREDPKQCGTTGS